MRKKTIKVDFCVVGAGAGGLSFAAGAVQMGASVVLVESSKMGGDCLNVGCVPSKALLAAAKMGDHLKKAKDFGWSVPEPSLDFKAVNAHVKGVIDAIAPNDSVERFEKLGVQVIPEEGHFQDKNTLETDSFLIKAKYFIIATGSYPFVPPIEGLRDVPFYTNETIFDLQELPTHLVVIGGGPIGIEMAQAFRRLGSEVTVLEASILLPKDDTGIVAKLKKVLIQEGVQLHEHIKIQSVTQKSSQACVKIMDTNGLESEIMASHILVAAGRRPHIAALKLDQVGVQSSPKGIQVTETLQTTQPRIYALGDCVGGYQFTHVAGYHAGLVIRNSIFGLRAKVNTTAIPWVTYTDPELAHVGATESLLQEQRKEYRVLEATFEDNDRAQCERKTTGEIKVLVSKKGMILGVTILGAHAGELIYPWVMAMANNLKISSLSTPMVPYPTLNDITKRVAGSYYKDKIFSPIMQKIVRLLLRMR